MKKINKASLRKAINIGMNVAMIVVLLASIYYNFVLERQVRERDTVIKLLTQRGSVFQYFLEAKIDSTGSSYSYSFYRDGGGQAMSYHTIYNRYDSISKLRTIEISELSKDYNSLVDDYNKLLEINSALKDSIIICKSIANRSIGYGLLYNAYKDKNEHLIIEFPLSRLDSAMMLFPHYRHKIHEMELLDNKIQATIIVEKD